MNIDGLTKVYEDLRQGETVVGYTYMQFRTSTHLRELVFSRSVGLLRTVKNVS